MKILIVDDEPLVRIGIKSSINWQEYGMEIIGEAADGEEAVRLMLEKNPDVVFLDIKMPKKDGIQVLQEMKELALKSKVVILSSFDDLHTVKQAMKFGAVDYFHKPSMNEHEMLTILLKMKTELETESTAHGNHLFHTSNAKEAILRDLLAGNVGDVSQTKLKEQNLYVFLFKVRNFKKVVQRYPADQPAFLQKTIMNLLAELFSKEKQFEFLQLEENLFCVFLSSGDIKSQQHSYTATFEKAQLIQKTFVRFLNIETVFGISGTVDKFNQVGHAFMQAKHALKQAFYEPCDCIFFFQNMEEDKALEQIDAYLVELKKTLANEEDLHFLEILAAFEQFLQAHKSLGERELIKIYDGLMFMIAETENYLGYRKQLEEMETFAELSSFYHQLFQAKFSARTAWKNRYSPIIKSILQYVNENYHQPLSLNGLSEKFNVSPNYISRLFKKEVGKGLFDYMNEQRIEKAKKLLKEYHYKIYEIAELVGFKSQVHFAIVFHKYTGTSPKDYRKEHV